MTPRSWGSPTRSKPAGRPCRCRCRRSRPSTACARTPSWSSRRPRRSARDALARRVDALLEREYPGLEALSQAEFKKHTTEAINQQFSFFNAIVAIAVLVGVLGIINTLSMSVLERTREIGVLRALGASRWRVRRTMADESLLISLAGTLVRHRRRPRHRRRLDPGHARDHVPRHVDVSAAALLGTIAVLGVVIGVVAAILPARRAARLEPLAALRYE